MNMENPYESPEAASGGEAGSAAEKQKLFEIAKAQRFVCNVILLAIIGNIGANIVAASVPQLTWAALAVLGVISICQVVAMYQLGQAVHASVAFGCMMAFLAVIPCFGLLALLVVNGQATKTLQQAGYRVGLMGANLNQFE